MALRALLGRRSYSSLGTLSSLLSSRSSAAALSLPAELVQPSEAMNSLGKWRTQHLLDKR
ncbi:hypothetical protein Taro_050591 [Colocasia esculenta]|uniref:Uncharacterized protein n=1 Tax=Colocasia esculenta TaxID=4460 RepID=A0A843XEM3_COLES|nr:hypothetical protein [Colocasia esculenta]